MTLVERVEMEASRPREPLQVRAAVLTAAAGLVYAAAWSAGRLVRGVVAMARFAWAAARVGWADGYRKGASE